MCSSDWITLGPAMRKNGSAACECPCPIRQSHSLTQLRCWVQMHFRCTWHSPRARRTGADAHASSVHPAVAAAVLPLRGGNGLSGPTVQGSTEWAPGGQLASDRMTGCAMRLEVRPRCAYKVLDARKIRALRRRSLLRACRTEAAHTCYTLRNQWCLWRRYAAQSARTTFQILPSPATAPGAQSQ